jgi:phage gpG-like protein
VAVAGIEVRVDASHLVSLLQQAAQHGGNLSNINEGLAEELLLMVEENFATQGHGQWPPLEQSTIDRRRRGRGSGSDKILQDSGTLAGSMYTDHDDGGFEVYTDVPYSRFHVAGLGVQRRDPFEIDEEAALERFGELLVQEVGDLALGGR